jgi:hypothetical protein
MGISAIDIKRRVNHADISMTARYADHLIMMYRKECSGWGKTIQLRTEGSRVKTRSRNRK